MSKQKLMKLKDWYVQSEKLVQSCKLYWEYNLEGKSYDELTEKEKRMHDLLIEYVYKRAIVQNILNLNGIFIM